MPAAPPLGIGKELLEVRFRMRARGCPWGLDFWPKISIAGCLFGARGARNSYIWILTEGYHKNIEWESMKSFIHEALRKNTYGGPILVKTTT